MACSCSGRARYEETIEAHEQAAEFFRQRSVTDPTKALLCSTSALRYTGCGVSSLPISWSAPRPSWGAAIAAAEATRCTGSAFAWRRRDSTIRLSRRLLDPEDPSLEDITIHPQLSDLTAQLQQLLALIGGQAVALTLTTLRLAAGDQLPSVSSLIPRSRATCAIGFPVCR